ncbi:MAG: hypothetical protein ACT4OK_11165 [Gemmobacter sp.]
MPLPALESLSDINLSDADNLKLFRAALRTALLADTILGKEDSLIIEQSFSGEGDSGDWQERHENPYVQHLFDHLLQTQVTFDWYNNEGGGGSVTWDVVADLITIDGYWNELIQHDVASVILDADGEELEAA